MDHEGDFSRNKIAPAWCRSLLCGLIRMWIVTLPRLLCNWLPASRKVSFPPVVLAARRRSTRQRLSRSGRRHGICIHSVDYKIRSHFECNGVAMIGAKSSFYSVKLGCLQSCIANAHGTTCLLRPGCSLICSFLPGRSHQFRRPEHP